MSARVTYTFCFDGSLRCYCCAQQTFLCARVPKSVKLPPNARMLLHLDSVMWPHVFAYKINAETEEEQKQKKMKQESHMYKPQVVHKNMRIYYIHYTVEVEYFWKILQFRYDER